MPVRREYTLWMPVQIIMTLMGNWRHRSYLALPWLERCADGEGKKVEIPADYEIVDATYDWSRKSVGIRISHPSFPVVPEGEYSPVLYYREVTIEARPILNPVIDEDAPGSIIVEALK
jgi:hypothetical protein